VVLVAPAALREAGTGSSPVVLVAPAALLEAVVLPVLDCTGSSCGTAVLGSTAVLAGTAVLVGTAVLAATAVLGNTGSLLGWVLSPLTSVWNTWLHLEFWRTPRWDVWTKYGLRCRGASGVSQDVGLGPEVYIG
jgi:hypothetical protein